MRVLTRLGLGVASAALALGVPAAALGAEAADSGNIDHIESVKGQLTLLYSVPATSGDPDLGTVQVTVDGEPVEAEAELASEAAETVRRTAVLAIDVSNSMAQDDRFEQAKIAARAFLDTTPEDVYVGIVTFADDVQTVQQPTQNRDAAAAVVDDLSLSRETSLYDGVLGAVEAVGDEGQRSILVLSDGRDTTDTALDEVLSAVESAGTKVDVVALSQSKTDQQPLEQIAAAGDGALLTADDPEALSALFSAEADVLARQVLISAAVPAGAADEGSVAVSLQAGDETYTDTAFVSLTAGSAVPATPAPPIAVAGPKYDIPLTWVIGGIAAAALGFVVMLLSALGVFEKQRTETLADRIAAYARTGDARAAAGTPGVRLQAPKPEGITGSAVGVAQKALSANKGFEVNLGQKLEAAGLHLKPAEWLLIHAGIAVGAALVGFLFSSAGLVLTATLFFVGAVFPWVFLGLKRSRRVKAFNSQLADTLQLMSGSLSAGLSLAQSVDTVVREGSDPMASELKKALVETRLGVDIEDALSSVGQRMESQDFEWIVMAIRIQREVGGNLAELLNNVSETLREREYLRRHVSALSAEGRLSAWILGGLPPGFILYLTVSRPDYLKPMVTTTLGWIMCGAIVFLTLVGGLWMKKLVKVEV